MVFEPLQYLYIWSQTGGTLGEAVKSLEVSLTGGSKPLEAGHDVYAQSHIGAIFYFLVHQVVRRPSHIRHTLLLPWPLLCLPWCSSFQVHINLHLQVIVHQWEKSRQVFKQKWTIAYRGVLLSGLLLDSWSASFLIQPRPTFAGMEPTQWATLPHINDESRQSPRVMPTGQCDKSSIEVPASQVNKGYIKVTTRTQMDKGHHGLHSLKPRVRSFCLLKH